MLSVYLAAVADLHNEDAQRAVLDAADNAVISYAVLPEVTQLGAFKGFAYAARIVQHGHSLAQESSDAFGKLLVQLRQVFLGRVV